MFISFVKNVNWRIKQSKDRSKFLRNWFHNSERIYKQNRSSLEYVNLRAIHFFRGFNCMCVVHIYFYIEKFRRRHLWTINYISHVYIHTTFFNWTFIFSFFHIFLYHFNFLINFFHSFYYIHDIYTRFLILIFIIVVWGRCL